MKKTTLIVLVLLFSFSGVLFAKQPAPIKVREGLIQGIYEDSLTVYKGVPFAAPPVGDLRWRTPQPAAKWEGSKNKP